MGAYTNAAPGQDLFGDAACDAQGSRQPTGEVTAATHIRLSAPLDTGGIVRMGRTGLVEQFAVIRRMLVTVFDNGAQGEAAGDAVFKTGQEDGCVRFLPGGGKKAFARAMDTSHSPVISFSPRGIWISSTGSPSAMPASGTARKACPMQN